MPTYDVTWQMTGTMRVEATDDLDAKTKVDALSKTELVQAPGASPVSQVIATRTVE